MKQSDIVIPTDRMQMRRDVVGVPIEQWAKAKEMPMDAAYDWGSDDEDVRGKLDELANKLEASGLEVDHGALERQFGSDPEGLDRAIETAKHPPIEPPVLDVGDRDRGPAEDIGNRRLVHDDGTPCEDRLCSVPIHRLERDGVVVSTLEPVRPGAQRVVDYGPEPNGPAEVTLQVVRGEEISAAADGIEPRRASGGSRAREAKSKSPPTGEGEPRIEYMDIDGLPPAPRNAKKHDGAGIRRSFKRFGFVSPPLINERTGRLVAGHGRIEELQVMRAKGVKAPRRIRVEKADNTWLVPVIRGISFETDEEAELYVLADNRLTENGGVDNDMLADILRDYQHEDQLLAGYDTNAVKEILGESDDDDDGGDDGGGIPVNQTFAVVIHCDDEDMQLHVLEYAASQNWKAKALT